MTTALCATTTTDPDLWLSSHRADRMRAAEMCRACPIRRECYADAEQLRTRPIPRGPVASDEPTWLPWGVWGGFSYDGTREAPTPVPEFKHGRNRYRAGCRCDVCQEAGDRDNRRPRRRAA